jgi:hypothetical protein
VIACQARQCCFVSQIPPSIKPLPTGGQQALQTAASLNVMLWLLCHSKCAACTCWQRFRCHWRRAWSLCMGCHVSSHCGLTPSTGCALSKRFAGCSRLFLGRWVHYRMRSPTCHGSCSLVTRLVIGYWVMQYVTEAAWISCICKASTQVRGAHGSFSP